MGTTEQPALPGDDTAAPPQSVTDEELFETYLAARLQQALEALNGARDELAAQPNDLNRALTVMRKVQELRDAQAELVAQRGRVAAARAAAGLATSPNADTLSETVQQATPGVPFRAAQAQHAARVMAALTVRPHTCPSCQALLATDAVRCHCGHAVNAETDGTRFNGAGLLGPTSPSAL